MICTSMTYPPLGLASWYARAWLFILFDGYFFNMMAILFISDIFYYFFFFRFSEVGFLKFSKSRIS